MLFLEKNVCGGGVPPYITEAEDLFSERVRSVLAMRNLWDEREPFLKIPKGVGC